MRRGPIPASLGQAFTVTDAAIAGVSASRLRAHDLETPFRGMRALPVQDEAKRVVVRSGHELLREAARERAVLFSQLLRSDQFFTHVTAAILWGLPVPMSLLRPGPHSAEPHVALLDVGVLTPFRRSRRSDVRAHRVVDGTAHVIRHPTLGVSVASPASTWAMLGAVLGPYDLVAVGDAVVREQMFRDDPPPLATPARLQAAIESGRRVGIGALRAALERVRTRSASRPETWSRLTLVDAGLDEPDLNFPVLDAAGELVAVVDLAYRGRKVAVEYEGEHHLRDPAQWAKDIARHERLAALGWIVIRVTKVDLFHDPASVVARVSRALDSRR